MPTADKVIVILLLTSLVYQIRHMLKLFDGIKPKPLFWRFMRLVATWFIICAIGQFYFSSLQG